MQTAQQKIQTYLNNISHGVINITEQHANAIMFFAAGGDYVATAIMYRHSALNKKYELLRTINTTDEQIDKYNATSFMHDEGALYKYECLKGNGDMVTLYSNQCSLFD